MLATALDVTPRTAPTRTAPTRAIAQSTLTPGADMFARYTSPCPVKAFEAKEHIFRDGDAATHVYRIEIGHVCIYRMLPDGRRQVIDFAYPGDIIGLGAVGEHAASAQATSRTTVRCLAVAGLGDVIRRDPALGLTLYEAVSHELLAAREQLFTVTQRTASERLAAFLLALSRRNARKGVDASEIVLPMTRADIADFLGLTIETVSRMFTRFRSDGLIDIEQCILVTIVDPAGLAEAAGEGLRSLG